MFVSVREEKQLWQKVDNQRGTYVHGEHIPCISEQVKNMAHVALSLSSVSAEESDLMGRDHGTLVMRDLANVIFGFGGDEFPTNVSIATLLQLCNVRQVNTPEGGKGSFFKVTTAMDVHAINVKVCLITNLKTYYSWPLLTQFQEQWLALRSGSLPWTLTSIQLQVYGKLRLVLLVCF